MIGAAVRSQGRAGQGNASENTLRTRVGEHFSTHHPVCRRLSRTTNRARGNAGVSAKLDLALQHSTCPRVIHYQDDEVSGLAARLQAKAAAGGLHHGGCAPWTVEIRSCPACHDTTAIRCPNDKADLLDGGQHDDAL